MRRIIYNPLAGEQLQFIDTGQVIHFLKETEIIIHAANPPNINIWVADVTETEITGNNGALDMWQMDTQLLDEISMKTIRTLDKLSLHRDFTAEYDEDTSQLKITLAAESSGYITLGE